MMERRTQAIMDRLDGLLGTRSGSRIVETNSGKTSREPRVNFNEQTKRRRTYGSTRGRGSSSSHATGDNRPRGPNIRGGSTGNNPTSDERPTRDANETGRCDSTSWSHANHKRSQPSDSNRREIPQPPSEGNNDQAGHSRDATAMATAYEHLNRSLETFLARLSRSSERKEKSRRVFKKPRCYKNESDGCIDTWIEIMKLHLEEENLTERPERQESSALTSNLDRTALIAQWSKNNTIFEIVLNRFGSGVQGHQVFIRFEKRRQREDETKTSS